MRKDRKPVSEIAPILILATAATAAATPAAAQQAVPEANEVVVTATRLGAGIPGASTTVITADDIQASPAHTLTDLLGREAGIQSRDYYAASAADSVIDLRGFGATASSNTLILVNGRRLNDFDLAAVDFGNIPLDSIERIEITRGNAGAVLYGDGAVGGVVNIITKAQAKAGPHGRADVAYGSYVHREVNLSATDGIGPWSLSAYGTAIDSRNYRQNNDIEQSNLVAEARHRNDAGEVYLNLGLDKQRLGTPGARKVTLTSTQLTPESVRRAATTPHDYTRQNGISLTAGGTHALSDRVDLIVDAGYRIKDTETRTVSNYGTQYNTYIDTELATWSLTPRIDTDFEVWGRSLTGTTGIDYSYSDYNSDRQLNPDGAPYHQYDAKQHAAAVYSQNTLALSDDLDLSFGGRVQYTRFIGGDIFNGSLLAYPQYDGHRAALTDGSVDFAADLGLEYRMTKALTLFGRVGRAFRAPTVDERVGSDPSHKSFALKTQSSRDVEAGVRVNVGDVEVQSSAYLMKLRDELHYDPDTSVNRNYDPTRRWGVENTATWRPTKALRLSANLSYTKATFTDGSFAGNAVPLVSTWTGGAQLDWDVVGRDLTVTAAANYHGGKRMENDEKNFQPQVPAYTLVDLRVGGEHGPLRWAATVDNVLDVDYYNYAVASSSTYGTYNAYPLPGRTYRLEAGVKF